MNIENVQELHTTDVLIIGSGVAGLTAAIELAENNIASIVITRSPEITDTNTRWAQGGIIYKGDEDSPGLLIKDIEAAGAGFCHHPAVELLATKGPEYLEYLLLNKLKVPFDLKQDHSLATCKEAAHSIDRIIHAKDATGKVIQESLSKEALANPLIKVLSNHTAIDLITPDHHSSDKLTIYQPKTCVGAYVLNNETQKVSRILAKTTLLASGGLGQIFLHSSNPKGSRGDGIAMANRAGARIINTEFVQFHPTTFYKKGAANFLISEAVRGAGGKLVDENGVAFMQKYAPEWLDLAPRDVVSRSIFTEMTLQDRPCMYLDISSHLPAEEIINRFPTIYQHCLDYGVDITQELIPVTPAAHYSCGGIWVDKSGKTDVKQLYAIGEVACTGLHGANRLASTSLLEGLVWGIESSRQIVSEINSIKSIESETIPSWKTNTDSFADEVLIQHDIHRIQSIMWNYVGLSRSPERLIRALRELRNLETEIEQFYRKNKVSDLLIGLRNTVRTSIIITLAAWSNRTSVGCHFREDG
jgi:L-aspartate oxidase